MATSCAVLIADPQLWPRVKNRLDWAGEILTFPEAESLQALDLITHRHPQLVVLHQHFATTCRGATLINRIRSDAKLSGCQISVIVEEPIETRGSHKRADQTGPMVVPLAHYGTRRDPRVKVPTGIDVLVDGHPAALVDLSAGGAQVETARTLRPDQPVRLTISDSKGRLRLQAVVAWAMLDLSRRDEPRYRAGLAFRDAGPEVLERFCTRRGMRE